MNATITTLVISGLFAILTAVITPIITINLNRAQAVKYLTEAAEKVGLENKNLSQGLEEARKIILLLCKAFDKVIPLLNTDEAHKAEVRELVDQARIDMP